MLTIWHLLMLWLESSLEQKKRIGLTKVELPIPPRWKLRSGSCVLALWKKATPSWFFQPKSQIPTTFFVKSPLKLTIEAIKCVGIVDGGLLVGPVTLGVHLWTLWWGPKPFWRPETGICQLMLRRHSSTTQRIKSVIMGNCLTLMSSKMINPKYHNNVICQLKG